MIIDFLVCLLNFLVCLLIRCFTMFLSIEFVLWVWQIPHHCVFDELRKAYLS